MSEWGVEGGEAPLITLHKKKKEKPNNMGRGLGAAREPPTTFIKINLLRGKSPQGCESAVETRAN